MRLLPRKLTWNRKNGDLVQIIFLFKQVIFRWTMLVFGGDTVDGRNLAPRGMVLKPCR